ncbi:MAG: hypothetical protein ABH840_02540 [Nanoarchaeota archaeon]
MRKRGLIFLALLVLFSIVLVYAQDFNSGKLVLNSEDEVNGEIVSSENLNVGDTFYLEDGRKARVSRVEEVVNYVDNSYGNFDNLNFFANGVLVHNKPYQQAPIPGVLPPRELTSSKLEAILAEEAGLPGEVWSGVYKDTTPISAVHGIPDGVPPSIRDSVENIIERNHLVPPQRDFVIKTLNPRTNRFDFDDIVSAEESFLKYQREASLPNELNELMYSELGYSPVPRVYSWKVEKIVGDDIQIRGVFFQQRVNGPSLFEIQNKFRSISVSGAKQTEREFLDLMKIKYDINDELERVYSVYNRATKAKGVRIFDLNNDVNVLFEFTDKCSGRTLTFENVLSKNGVPLNQIDIRVYTPDIGATVLEGSRTGSGEVYSGGIYSFNTIP